MQLREGLTVADRFCLVRELGRGGMGSVWLAQHTALDVLCAIKFIDRERNTPEMRARFEQEAKAAAQLRSPHVVQILDYGVWEGLPYIAMEHLQGEDLAQRLERELVLSPVETYRIVAHVARALSKAHAAGIVHRDLKPENVFIVRDEEEEVAKVLDFGIAKRSSTRIDNTTTKPGALLGTPFYMSPEQARGNCAVDHRSDLWSLAVISYQALTGHLPFASDGLGDVLSQIIHEPLPVPSQVYPDVPPGFDIWWQRAASRDPETRFQSAKELCDALGEALEVYESIVLTEVTSRVPDVLETTGSHAIPAAATVPQRVLLSGSVTDGAVSRTYSSELERSGRRRKLLLGLLAIPLLGAVVWLGLHRGTSQPARPAAAPEIRPGPVVAPPDAERKLGDAASASPTRAAATDERAPGTTTAQPKTVRSKPKRPIAPAAKPQKRRVDFGI